MTPCTNFTNKRLDGDNTLYQWSRHLDATNPLEDGNEDELDVDVGLITT